MNIVLKCDANARNAHVWNRIMFIILYIGYGLGIKITDITTNSAYKISNHVNIAQMIPHMSLMHHSIPPQHLLCMSISLRNEKSYSIIAFGLIGNSRMSVYDD